jgi:hypothetical protein
MKHLSQKLFASCALLLLVTLFLAAEPVWAGAPAQDCAHPFVFSDAAVNFVVLPFTNSVSLEMPLSKTATQLTLMVQTETIFSILKYGSVGAVRLTARPGEQAQCKPEIVAAKLLGEQPGAQQTIRPGHGLILFWGRLYEENKEIYVQSFTSFLRKGVSENLSLPLENARYEARLLDEAVAFAPQRLTEPDLAEIESEFGQYAVVHQDPLEGSPGTRMPLELSPFANGSYFYRVSEVRNEWMRIQAYGIGPSGWIHAGGNMGPFRSERMPELAFVDGVAGYLRLRGSDDGDTQDASLRTVSWAEAALKRYEEAADPVQAPLALAVAKTVHGLLEMLGPLQANSKRQTALQLFQEASDLVPYSGEARNLELTTRWYLAYHNGSPGIRPAVIADGWLQAAVLAPEDPTILKNLENCYELLLKKGSPPGAASSGGLDGAEIEKRLAALRSVQNSGR